ncbi:MAG: hypothetical protein IT349_04695 [Candidatus Eisenbacteria bacterium]|nr:hypothetical protein [Candidatus Eisenbacteria bacterium]
MQTNFSFPDRRGCARHPRAALCTRPYGPNVDPRPEDHPMPTLDFYYHRPG